MSTWVFERQTRDGGAAGEAVPNAVEAGGWSSSEELLIREAIQNSVDAGLSDDAPVKVTFRLQHFTEDSKAEMLNNLQLRSFQPRSKALKLPPGNVIGSIEDPSQPLNLLYIEDHNTCGLGGGLSDRIRGNFFRLLFLIGDGSKGDQNDGSGGSFGFGKGVYAYNSNIRTIIVFSVFEPTSETGGHWARLLGCSYLPSHEHEDETWTGRAWFGIPNDGSDSSQAPFPIVNDEACALAEKLGFSPRSKGDYGTSILIVGSDSVDGEISTAKLKAAAETWWWPRLTDGKLSVELVEQGMRHPGLNPAARADLQPFIKVRNCLINKDRSDEVSIPAFRGSRGYQLGALGLTAIPPDHDAYEPLAQADENAAPGKAPSHRSIAYIRHPGMVVAYQTWTMPSNVSAIGVFQAHDDIDRHLKLSEPMEHDRWDPHSRRLAAVEHGFELVDAVQRKCRKNLRDFLKSLQPPPPPPRGGLEWLGKLLGQVLTPRDQAPPAPPSGERGAISIQSRSRPSTRPAGNDTVELEATYLVGLKDPDADDSIKVLIAPRLYVLEGDGGARGATLPIRVQTADGAQFEGEKPEFLIELNGTGRQPITIISEPYPADWAVSIHMETRDTQEEGE